MSTNVIQFPVPELAPNGEPEGKYFIPFKCARTGLVLGRFFPNSSMGGSAAYVQSWKESIFYHPIFSYPLSTLLHKANAYWQLEKSGTRQVPMLQKQLLFLALLHASGCIRQDIACLPAPVVVETFFPQLLELLGWKEDVNSDRLRFPRLHIWKGAGADFTANAKGQKDPFSVVATWIIACEVCKDEWENVVREKQKAAKQKAAVLAMRSIRRSMYNDISLRRLWNWVTTQVPQFEMENNQDLEQLFFAEESKIHAWDKADIVALEDLILANCETGNSISYECFKRIHQLRAWLELYEDAFEIVDSSGQFAELKGVPAPEQKDFPSKSAWLVSKAKWDLANKINNPETDADQL